jgi:hypothetical protein
MPRVRRKSVAPAPISLGGRVREPSLPFPWVEYPKHYGTFFRFAAEEAGPYLFCECNRRALEHFSLLRQQRTARSRYGDDIAARGLHLPSAAAQEIAASPAWSPDPVATHSRACHRCNLAPPSLRYCHEMYGGTWKQSYGWYTNLAFIEGGIEPITLHSFLAEKVPSAIAVEHAAYVVEYDKMMVLAQSLDNASFAPLQAIHKTLGKLKTRINRHFESEAREAFGFRRVGDGWVSETLLFQLVQLVLPEHLLLRHHRPEWLNGLELDIYVPALNCGIEYQGRQHARAIPHWGGESALAAQKARDREKKRLCASAGCVLLEIWHDEPLSLEHVSSRLAEFGVGKLSTRTL